MASETELIIQNSFFTVWLFQRSVKFFLISVVFQRFNSFSIIFWQSLLTGEGEGDLSFKSVSEVTETYPLMHIFIGDLVFLIIQ